MHLTIRHKLFGLGSLGLVFSAALGLTVLQAILQVAGEVQNVSETSSAIRPHMEANQFLDLTRADLSKILRATGEAQDTAAAELSDHQKLVIERLGKAGSVVRDPEISAALREENQAVSDYFSKANKLSDSRKDAATSLGLLGGGLQAYQDLRNMMDGVNDKLQAKSVNAKTKANHLVNRSKLTIVILCLVSALSTFLIAFLIARNINRRLASVIERLKELAGGDLTQQMDDAQADELGELARWFNDSIGKLRKVIAQVGSSAMSVKSAVEQLTSVSGHMSENSEQTTLQANV